MNQNNKTQDTDREAFETSFKAFYVEKYDEEPSKSHNGFYMCTHEFIEVDDVYKDGFDAGLKHARAEASVETEKLKDDLREYKNTCSQLHEIRDADKRLIEDQILEIKKLREELRFEKEKTQELKEELKCVSVRDFCYDLQVWVGDFLLANKLRYENGLYSFQDIRKAVYTHRVNYYKQTPAWGDESYLIKEKQK